VTSNDTAPDMKFEIKNRQPIELIDLTNSLLALGNEYQRFISLTHPEADASDVKLYINEVRSGSVIALLTAMSPQLIEGFNYVNTVVDFATFLKSSFELLSSGKANKHSDLSPATLNNISQILEPIAKDSGSQLNIGTLNVTGNVYLNVPSTEANVIQNQIMHIGKERRAKTHGLHEKVLLHWYQARKDTNNKFGDKAIIEAISTNPVKVICANDELKARMVLSEKNPFNEAFIVDVVADTLNEKIVLYKIVEMHERFIP
jgi:hypothetical protein